MKKKIILTTILGLFLAFAIVVLIVNVKHFAYIIDLNTRIPDSYANTHWYNEITSRTLNVVFLFVSFCLAILLLLVIWKVDTITSVNIEEYREKREKAKREKTLKKIEKLKKEIKEEP